MSACIWKKDQNFRFLKIKQIMWNMIIIPWPLCESWQIWSSYQNQSMNHGDHVKMDDHPTVIMAWSWRDFAMIMVWSWREHGMVWQPCFPNPVKSAKLQSLFSGWWHLSEKMRLNSYFNLNLAVSLKTSMSQVWMRYEIHTEMLWENILPIFFLL